MEYLNNIFRKGDSGIKITNISKLANLVYDIEEHKICRVKYVFRSLRGTRGGLKNYLDVTTEEDKLIKIPIEFRNGLCFEINKGSVQLYTSYLHFERDFNCELNKQEKLVQNYLLNYEKKIKQIEDFKKVKR